ncbi:hypothetical protein FDF80_19200, partial [Clostridium sporogenes]|nr:hypothetical protein [Clostridium sporogenes]
MDINKIAKEMTREEFLQSEYVIDKEDEEKDLFYSRCPSNYGLKESDCYCICAECWENAIKDIKFKGEDNMEFNFDNFKYNFIAVHCNTEYELNDFFKRCEENNIKISRERKFNAKLCYEIIDTDILIGGDIEYYKNQDYDIIEWEMESPVIENKIDYDREYNIMEIMEFEEGTEFKHNNYIYRIMEGILEVKYYNDNKAWIQCNCIDKC